MEFGLVKGFTPLADLLSDPAFKHFISLNDVCGMNHHRELFDAGAFEPFNNKDHCPHVHHKRLS